MTEAKFVRALVVRITDRGYHVSLEARSLTGGACDIAIYRPDPAVPLARGPLFALVEAKVADPLKGIGQLHSYAAGIDPRPGLILAVPRELDSPRLRHACESTGVTLWSVDATRKFDEWVNRRAEELLDFYETKGREVMFQASSHLRSQRDETLPFTALEDEVAA